MTDDHRKPLTPKQRSFLVFLVEHWAEHQRFPEFAEIMARFSRKSLNSVSQYYRALAAKGYCVYAGGGPRLIGLDPSQAAADYLARLPPPDEE